MQYQMTTRRKLAIATWSSPKEGNIYGKISVDLSDALRYIQYLRAQSGEHISITHVVGKAVAKALSTAPEVNGRIVFGRYVPHETVDVSFLVSLNEGTDLAKAKVSHIDQKSIVEIAADLREKSTCIRSGKDSEFEKSKSLLRVLPTWLLRPLVWMTGFLTGALGMEIKALGLERFPFGACIITSVGMFGIDEGYAPPTPFARVPVYIAITRIKDRVVARNGEVAVRPEVDLMATIDHRFMDGHQGAMLAKVIREGVEKPWLLDGLAELPKAHA